jgi:hypothetical protein
MYDNQMSTMHMLKVGVELAGHILGKPGPIELEYYNERVEENGPIGCGTQCHSDYDSDEERESPINYGKLGHIFIGQYGQDITTDHIIIALNRLVEAGYARHYVVEGVSFNPIRPHVTLQWT